MFKVLLIGSLLLGCLTAGGTIAVDEPFEGLDGYIEGAMADWQVPGLAIAVYHHDKLIYSGAFGVRQVGTPDPVDLDTVFAYSSNGKAFTATVAAMAVDDGLIGWDDPITTHLDYFQLPDPWVTRTVTIRDLLAHRVSGDLGVGKLQLWAYTALDRDEVLSAMRYLKPGTPRFRGEFQYSNPNILAAGQAVGIAAGTSWDQFIDTRLLDALEMETATSSVTELWAPGQFAPCYMCAMHRTPDMSEAKIDNIAMPHVASENGPRVIPWRTVDSIAPAGSINGSVLDFARFMRLHLNGGEFGGRRLVSKEAIKETHTPQMIINQPIYPAGEGFSRMWAYGMGWFITEYREHKVVMHTGGITGWNSGIVMLPEEELGIAVVSNQQSAHLTNRLAPALGFVVLDHVLGLPRVDRSARWLKATRAELARANEYEQQMLSQKAAGTDVPDVAGEYTHRGFGKLTIAPSGEVKLGQVMDGKIEHWGNDRYRIYWGGPWPTSALLRVVAAPNGEVGGIELEGFGFFDRR